MEWDLSQLNLSLYHTHNGLGAMGLAATEAKEVQLGQKVAIYCCVSTSDQFCARQERDLLEYAARAGDEVVGVWKETASGTKTERPQRKKVMALAQARQIDAVLVTELTRWGRSTFDLVHTLHDLQSWNVSLIAQTGLRFDLQTPQGKLVASLMAALANLSGISCASVSALAWRQPKREAGSSGEDLANGSNLIALH